MTCVLVGFACLVVGWGIAVLMASAKHADLTADNQRLRNRNAILEELVRR